MGEVLAKNGIRLQYSGFIIFTARMISVATGMIFTLLLTRQELTGIKQQEFGIWANIFDLVGYFTILAAALPFWTMRFVARGKEGAAKTGFLANLMIALISAALYLPIIPFVTASLGVASSYLILYFLASLQIVNIYLINVLEATLRAEKPEAVGYGLLTEEIFKITLAYVLMVQLQLGLWGAMISLATGTLAQVLYYVKLTINDFKHKIQWNYVKEWFKGSTANIYYMIGNQLASVIFIWLFVYGGPTARANHLAALTIANIVTYSAFLSFALYPKLLAKKNAEDITSSMRMVLMFAIPMTAIAVSMPQSFLTILNESYADAAPILVVLTFDAFITTLSGFYTYVLFGVERLDQESKIPLKQLARSNIFKAFTLSYIHASIALPIALYVLPTFAANQAILAPLYVGIINMTMRLAMFFVLLAIMRKVVRVIVPWLSVAKYVFAAAIMGALLYVVPHPSRITLTLGMAMAGAAVYLAILVVIDNDTKMLAISILREIKNRVFGAD